MMKKIALALTAAATVAAAAAPAAAQGWGPGYGHGGPGYGGQGYGHGPGIARGDNLEARIERGLRTGQLTHREARSLREQLRYAERLAYRYRADGVVTRWEQADLDRRFDAISARIRYEKHDRDYGYGYGPRY